MDIVFVISHKPDNRYKKRLELLSKIYSIGIIYWDKTGGDEEFVIDNVISMKINIKADRTNPLNRIPETLNFIWNAYKQITKLRVKCLYVGNLDMLVIAYICKKKNKNIRIIYEIADLHRLIIDKQDSLIKQNLSRILKITERKTCKSVDRLVLTSMKFYDVYYAHFVKKEKVVFLPNMPQKDIFSEFKKEKHKKFTIGFIGWIRYKDQLRLLIRAAQKTNVNIFFAGEDADGLDFQEECKRYSHVRYFGPFIYDKSIQDMYRQVDCIYAVYNADMANVRVALPNKLYEAILCELPIIVAKETYLSELVLNMGVGIAVNHKNEDELANAILKLSKDKLFYDNICENCRKQKKRIDLSYYNKIFLNEVAKIIG